MKRIWLYNVIFTALLCIVFLLVNYTLGMNNKGVGFFLALMIGGFAIAEVVVCAGSIFLHRKQETKRHLITATASCFVPLIFLLFIWNFLFISC